MKSSLSLSLKKNLYIDLDGTLTPTDTLWESALLHWKRNVFAPMLWFFWLLKGKSFLKKKLSEIAIPDVSVLPFNEKVIEIIRAHKESGGTVILATAANLSIAEAVAKHHGFFDRVLASNETHNLSRKNKAEELFRDSDGEFDYLGNSKDDIDVWAKSGRALLVAPHSFKSRLPTGINIALHIEQKSNVIKSLAKALRVYQWVKNLLLFVPLILAHRVSDSTALLNGILAFICYSLCASSVYVLNDLLDIESDRHHVRKRKRPFASADLPIPLGIVLIPILLSFSFGLAIALLPTGFVLALLSYLIVTMLYSFGLKKVPVLDVIILAGLYTFRVLSGGIAMAIPISPWLLMLSIFLFLSLAFVKRYAEIVVLENSEKQGAKGRGYHVGDKSILGMTGVSSGMLSVLVFVLYLRSAEVLSLYTNTHLLWLVPPLFLYWIAHVWFIANRGEMHDDPILFASKDLPSYLVFGLIALIMILAMSNIPIPRPW